jgi:hypothetical protein
MKYIKSFEMINNYNLKFNVGDYIVCNWSDNKLSKIIKINDTPNRNWDYVIQNLIEDADFGEYRIDQEQIERYMTKEEINKYNSIKNMIKFNI